MFWWSCVQLSQSWGRGRFSQHPALPHSLPMSKATQVYRSTDTRGRSHWNQSSFSHILLPLLMAQCTFLPSVSRRQSLGTSIPAQGRAELTDKNHNAEEQFTDTINQLFTSCRNENTAGLLKKMWFQIPMPCFPLHWCCSAYCYPKHSLKYWLDATGKHQCASAKEMPVN